MDTIATDQHSFVSITVVPVEASLEDDGTVSCRPNPLPDQDISPEQFCQVCWQPLDSFSLKSRCPGPRVPDDLSELTG